MKFLGQGGMAEAANLRSQQGTDRRFSQALELNCMYRIFVPIIDLGDDNWTVAAAAVVGRQLNYDALGSSFVLIEYTTDSLNRVHDVSGLDVYSRLSSVLYDAKYNSELARVDRDADADAKAMNVPVDVAGVNKRKEELRLAYYGGKVNGNNILPTERPLVGNVTVSCLTDVSIIKIKADESPEESYPTRVSLDLSSNKVDQLNKALRKLKKEDKERGYMELSYDYSGTTKQAAGQTSSFVYVKSDDWLENSYPGWFSKYGTEIGKRLLYAQEDIAAKNRNLAFSPAVEDVVVAFKNYVSTQRGLLPYIDTSTNAVKNSAEFMLTFNVFRGFDKLNTELQAIVNVGKEPDEEVGADAAIDKIAKAEDKIQVVEEVGSDVYDSVTAMMDEDMPSEM